MRLESPRQSFVTGDLAGGAGLGIEMPPEENLDSLHAVASRRPLTWRGSMLFWRHGGLLMYMCRELDEKLTSSSKRRRSRSYRS